MMINGKKSDNSDMNSDNNSDMIDSNNLVGGLNPSEKYEFVRQLGWWHSQYDGENNPFMFQTTNQ